MTVLMGVDPSLAGTGWCVLDTGDGDHVTGWIPTVAGHARGWRLSIIATQIRKVHRKYTPEHVAVEDIAWGSQSVGSACMVRAAVEIGLLDVPVEVVNPTGLKRWATGDGAADKSQMVAAARIHVGYRGRNDNEADACLIAAWLRHGLLIGELPRQKASVRDGVVTLP